MFDLEPAATRMSRLVSGVEQQQLARPTPCRDWTVADLLAHVHQLSSVFTSNARQQPPDPPQKLVPDWRAAIPRQLDELVESWRQESAWQGRVAAGGVEMAAADNAVVAVEELTVHGWDLARATGQPFEVTDVQLDHVEPFFSLFDDQTPAGEGPFGPVAPTPAGATRLESVLARTGRDPAWSTG